MNRRQSTNHIMMIEPAVFYANPETMETNVYQVPEEEQENRKDILQKAVSEFRAFRNKLVRHGVFVTTALGHEECPDMIFPNWISTHQEDYAVIYPMLNDNRRAERDPRLLDFISSRYSKTVDWSGYENEGLFLESTASIVADHVNKRGYAGLSKRTSRKMVEKWAAMTGYEMEVFETKSHTGKPVYHTDFLMFIGTTLAGVCLECIVDDQMRKEVYSKLSKTHEVMELSMRQLQNSSCNALEILGRDDKKFLAISENGYEALDDTQKEILDTHFEGIITSPLDTLEKYGGGSARCMMMEIF